MCRRIRRRLVEGAKFRCIVCEQVAEDEHIESEGKAGANGPATHGYRRCGRPGTTAGTRLPASQRRTCRCGEECAAGVGGAGAELAKDPRNLWYIPYGLTTFADLFTSRQLVALTTLSDLVDEVREEVLQDALAPDFPMIACRWPTGAEAHKHTPMLWPLPGYRPR